MDRIAAGRAKPRRADEAAARRARMAVLARAGEADLVRLWSGFDPSVEAETLRGPETGLVTVRGRIGGDGAGFNLGEATVTRATVRLATGEVGHAWALGRDREKARIGALVDALGQTDRAAAVEDAIIAPLRAAQEREDERLAEETAATRVDFFTMVRGED